MDLSLLLLSLLVLILTLFYFYSVRNRNYWKNQGIETAPGFLPLFGHVLSVILVRSNLSTVCNELYKNWLPKRNILGIFFLTKPMLIVRDPELIKNILIKDFQSFRNNMIIVDARYDPFLSKNPFFTTDEVWKKNRAYLVSKMSQARLKTLFAILQRISLKYDKYLERTINTHDKSNILELKTLAMKFTGEVVANTAFGIEGHSFDDHRNPECFTSKVETFLESSFSTKLTQMLRYYIPCVANLFSISFMPMKLSHFLMDTIRDVLQFRKEKGITANDLLQMAVESSDEHSVLEAAIGHASSYFFDAYDTSADVFAFVMYRLAYHQDIQDKARREIVETLSKYKGDLCWESLKDMVYLEQILNETLRLHPILGVSVRECNQKVTLESSDGQSVNLQPGDAVCIPIQSIHTDEEFWNEPLKFDPDRFSEERREYIRKFTFLPFSEGPRICAGKNYGIMLVKTMLAIVLRKYVLRGIGEIMPDIELHQGSLSTSAKHGLWVKFNRVEDS